MNDGREDTSDRGVGDALREAIERTLQATAGSAAGTRERAAELVDEVARRGREARHGITRRGQVAGAELARRGQDAGAELARRIEHLESRLADVEERLRPVPGTDDRSGGEEPGRAESNSKVED